MKKVFPGLSVILPLLFALFSNAFATGVPDRILAIVGQEIILDSQVAEQLLMYRLQNPGSRDASGLRKKILDNMISQKIILTRAKIDSVSVDQKSVDEIVSSRYNTIRSGFPSVSAMEARFGLPVNRLKESIRDEIRNQLLVDAFRRKHFRDVTLSRDEVMAYYHKEKASLPEVPEMVSFSQIVRYPDVSDAEKQEVLAKIKSVRDELHKGADFARTARKYSEDPGSRDLGGDLGYVHKGEFVPSFEKAALALKPGELSDIVESRFGYHLIQLIDKDDNGIHTRHILAMFDRSSTDSTKTLRELQEIRASVLSGKAAFARMAEQHSDDPQAAKTGGLITSASTGESDMELAVLKPELQQIISGLKSPGDISQPERVRPENGESFYIMLRLNSRTPAHVLSPEHDYERLEGLAVNSRRQELFDTWVEKLKKTVVVQIMSDI